MTNFKDQRVFQTSKELAEFLGSKWKELQEKHGRNGVFLVSSPLSSTPIPLYDWLVRNADSISHWDKMKFVLMDEQVDQTRVTYIPRDDSASYERFAREKLLDRLKHKIGEPNRVIVKPDLKDLSKLDKEIEAHGGIDLLVLAIGAKGHYAQVMPTTPTETGFHVARLIPEFITAHTQVLDPTRELILESMECHLATNKY